ncbi:hypothetical protein PSTT_12317, partial [Puccinia striiformis]
MPSISPLLHASLCCFYTTSSGLQKRSASSKASFEADLVGLLRFLPMSDFAHSLDRPFLHYDAKLSSNPSLPAILRRYRFVPSYRLFLEQKQGTDRDRCSYPYVNRPSLRECAHRCIVPGLSGFVVTRPFIFVVVLSQAFLRSLRANRVQSSDGGSNTAQVSRFRCKLYLSCKLIMSSVSSGLVPVTTKPPISSWSYSILNAASKFVAYHSPIRKSGPVNYEQQQAQSSNASYPCIVPLLFALDHLCPALPTSSTCAKWWPRSSYLAIDVMVPPSMITALRMVLLARILTETARLINEDPIVIDSDSARIRWLDHESLLRILLTFSTLTTIIVRPTQIRALLLVQMIHSATIATCLVRKNFTTCIKHGICLPSLLLGVSRRQFCRRTSSCLSRVHSLLSRGYPSSSSGLT